MCVMGSFVDAVNISCCKFWCDVIGDPFPHTRGCFCLGVCTKIHLSDLLHI